MSRLIVGTQRLGDQLASVARSARVVNQLPAFCPDWAFSRQLALLGGRAGGESDLDLDAECGYPTHEHVRLYHGLYARGGIATRVVDIWPDECWAAYPELYETESRRRTKFERAWDELTQSALPWHYLHRVDRMSGIGHFAVLLLGVGDGRDLADPVRGADTVTGRVGGGGTNELIYLRAFDETLVSVSRFETDPSNPRYGQPTEYKIQFTNPAVSGPSFQVSSGQIVFEGTVHWTRVIHVADNRHTSEVSGVPRMRPVLNYLHDIRKVCGGSAEMFWRGGFPGYAFEVHPDAMVEDEAELKRDVQEEIQLYSRGFRRYLTAMGGTWKSLSPQVADPTGHLTQYVNLMCATLGVPVPIFLGQQLGHLASNQNAAAWKERLSGRQKNYLEPLVVRPFVNRLMDLGILPRVDKYILSWRDLKTLSDTDRAGVALKQVQALMQYVTGGVDEVMPPRLMLTLLLGMTEAQADAVEEELKKNPPPEPAAPPAAVGGAGGGRAGNPGADPGRPTGRVEGQLTTANVGAPAPGRRGVLHNRRTRPGD